MFKEEILEKRSVAVENWENKFPEAFKSQIEILRSALPVGNIQGIELCLGSGQISMDIGIKEGIEPDPELRKLAKAKGIDVFDSIPSDLPYKDLHFDFVMMPSCIHFISKLLPSLREANRVLKPGGTVIIGCYDKKSKAGKFYSPSGKNNSFYRQVVYYSFETLEKELRSAGFGRISFTQTLFKSPAEIKVAEKEKEGFGEGAYVVIKAIKR